MFLGGGVKMRHAASTTICPSWIFSSSALDMYITFKCQNIFFEGGWLNSIYLYLRGGGNFVQKMQMATLKIIEEKKLK